MRGVTGQAAAPEVAESRVLAARWSDPRLPLILLPVVLVVALLAELSLMNAGVPLDGILTDAASGLAFTLAGLVAWRRRPHNRVGPLMLGIGLAWFGGDFLFAPVPLVGPLSFFSQAAARALFAWLLLAFPTGYLGSTLHRWAVGLIGALAAALAVMQLITLDPATLCPCPASPFAFAAGWPLAAELDNASAAVGMGMTVILVPLVVRRAISASPPARRLLIPVLAGGAFSLLSVLPDTIARLSGSAVEPITWLPIVWVALPLGFLVVLLESRMARAAVADLLLDLNGDAPPGLQISAPVPLADAGDGGHGSAARPGRVTVVVIGLLGAAVGLTLVWMAYQNAADDNPGLWAFLRCWASLTYVIAGLIAWRGRPESLMGPLMILAGFGTYLSFVVWSTNDVLYTIGTAFDILPPVLFLHVFLAYPTGRLRSGVDRLIVAAAYVAAGLTIPQMLLGLGGEQNLLAVYSAPEAADFLQRLQLLAMSLLMLAGIGVLAARRLAGPRPLRPAFGWLVDAFAVGLLMIALLLLAGSFDWSDLQPWLRAPTFFVIGLAPIVFLLGLLQARLVRSSVGDLLVSMGSNPGPSRLQESVARALRDPSVTIVYWVDELGEFADAGGDRVDLLPEDGRSVTPVQRDGETVAALVHDAALDDEPQLLAAVARAVGMAIENSQLQVELQARLADVRASRARIVNAGDEARRRLERDLHDGAQQRLVALSLAIRRAQNRLESKTDPALASSLEDASQLVRDALTELRELARGLHPAILTESGLSGGLQALASRSASPVTIEEVPEDRLPAPVEATVYFLVSEALTNIAKHAPGATATVRVTRRPDRVEVEVADDGPGGAVARPGSGLQGLEDRLAAAGGGLRVQSEAGSGTTLSGWISFEAAPPA
jgi:signal transduction histidine kinase